MNRLEHFCRRMLEVMGNPAFPNGPKEHVRETTDNAKVWIGNNHDATKGMIEARHKRRKGKAEDALGKSDWPAYAQATGDSER